MRMHPCLCIPKAFEMSGKSSSMKRQMSGALSLYLLKYHDLKKKKKHLSPKVCLLNFFLLIWVLGDLLHVV